MNDKLGDVTGFCEYVSIPGDKFECLRMNNER